MKKYRVMTSVTDEERGKSLTDEKGYILTADGKILIGYKGNESKLSIPDGVEVIANDTFKDRYTDGYPWSVSMTNSVIAIGSSAFKDCTDLSKIILSDNIEYIGPKAFDGCTGLTYAQTNDRTCPVRTFLVPHTVRNIEEGAFQRCTQITSFVLPDEISFIKDYVFQGCKALTEFTMPSTAIKIGHSAFKYSGIERLAVPSSVIDISNEAFAYCESLEELRLPNSLLNVGNDILVGCTSLECIIISKGTYPRMCELLPDFKHLFVEE